MSTGKPCLGGDACCSWLKPCILGEGDCDRDADCAHNLVCGKNNCKRDNVLKSRAFEEGDDCCTFACEDLKVSKVIVNKVAKISY